jgi:hypothetical protein
MANKDKNAERERLLKKQEEMRNALPGQLRWIAGMIAGFLALQLILGLFGLLLYP